MHYAAIPSPSDTYLGGLSLTNHVTARDSTRDHSAPPTCPPATMFSRSVRSITTAIPPPCSSSSSLRPLSSSFLNCNQSSFLSLRNFSQSSAAMSGNTKAFFEVQYGGKFYLLCLSLVCLEGGAGGTSSMKNCFCPFQSLPNSYLVWALFSRLQFIYPVLTIRFSIYRQDLSHQLQPVRAGRPEDR